MTVSAERVLVTGGSGYLGQFLVQGLSRAGFKVTFTHHSTAAPPFGSQVQACWVDFASGKGLHECFANHGPFQAVINPAAISTPGTCEKNPEAARAVNVPSKLLDELELQAAEHGTRALLIHVSTEQVYDGSRSNWREGEAGNPVNAYGRSKLEAEQVVQARWPEHVILRSSIIYGPEGLAPVPRPLFIQFIARQLAAGTLTSFFTDEWRNSIYVQDIVAVVLKLLQAGAEELPQRVFNMGGPERLSRVDMARKVAAAWGYSAEAIIEAPSSSVNRGVVSPADISMDSSRLEAVLGMRMTPFSAALAQFAPPPRECL